MEDEDYGQEKVVHTPDICDRRAHVEALWSCHLRLHTLKAEGCKVCGIQSSEGFGLEVGKPLNRVSFSAASSSTTIAGAMPPFCALGPDLRNKIKKRWSCDSCVEYASPRHVHRRDGSGDSVVWQGETMRLWQHVRMGPALGKLPNWPHSPKESALCSAAWKLPKG